MAKDGETVQANIITYLKSKTVVTSLLSTGAQEIREAEWQGEDFSYPNIRIGVDFMPAIEGCGPDDADITIDSFSAEKSSKQASHISAALKALLHKHPFQVGGMTFSTVVVRRVGRPERTIYGWMSQIDLFVQIAE